MAKATLEQANSALDLIRQDVDRLHGYYEDLGDNQLRYTRCDYLPGFEHPLLYRHVRAAHPTLSRRSVRLFVDDLTAGLSTIERAKSVDDAGNTMLLLALYASSDRNRGDDQQIAFEATTDPSRTLRLANVAVRPLLWAPGNRQWEENEAFEIFNLRTVQAGLPGTAEQAIAFGGIVCAMISALEEGMGHG